MFLLVKQISTFELKICKLSWFLSKNYINCRTNLELSASVNIVKFGMFVVVGVLSSRFYFLE